MANVMSLKHLSNKVHRNGFDLSFRNSFTAKVGELLPVMCKEVLPGDKFKIEPSWFTRTAPVSTAAFTRIREYYDFFFVPFNVLWSQFDDFITQMNNPSIAKNLSSASAIPSRLPYLQMSQLKNYLTSACLDKSVNNNVVGMNRGDTSVKLLQYLGYGGFDRPGAAAMDQTNIPVNVMPLLAYQKIYQDFYRDSQWEKSAPWTCNVDYIAQSGNSQVDISSLYNTSTGLKQDSTFLDLRYCNWNKDYFMGLLPAPQFGDTAFAPITLPTDETVSTRVMTPEFTVNDSSSYNVDDPLIVGGKDSSNNAYLFGVHESSGSARSLFNSVYGPVTHVFRGVDNIPISTGSLSILALRQAEALQKWKEISLSGDKDFRSQMQKHWNVDVGFSRSRMCKYLGGTFGNLDVSEVVNTNLNDGAYQADIAGKGIGSGDGEINFESRDYGLLMCIYHAVPLLDYENFKIDKFLTKLEPTDFAIPEMDSVGMQEVQNYEVSAYIPIAGVRPLGYAPRYVDYKTSIDVINGAFCTWRTRTKNNGYNTWVAPIDSWSLVSETTVGIDYSFFKVYPEVLNSIFLAQADSGMNTDCLLCRCDFRVSAVRNLDYDGLPY